jgi:hypothetical protein
VRVAAVAVGIALALAAGTAGAAPAATSPPEAVEAPPDEAATGVADANFELPARRSGYVFGFALGPALQVGAGIDEASGFAGGLSLRFGINASPKLVWLLQLDVSAYGAEEQGTNAVKLNNNAALTVAGQLYVREVLWLKVGVGAASFERRAERGGAALETLAGGAGMAAIGFDLLRRGRFVLGIEGVGFVGVYRDGLIASSAMLLGFNFY